MKKFLLFAAMAATLYACNNQESKSDPPDKSSDVYVDTSNLFRIEKDSFHTTPAQSKKDIHQADINISRQEDFDKSEVASKRPRLPRLTNPSHPPTTVITLPPPVTTQPLPQGSGYYYSIAQIVSNPLPGKYKCIKIDFDGEVIPANANWNVVNCVGIPYTDQQKMYIKDSVSKWFINYNVVITDDETVFKNADPDYRVRIVVTTTSAWYPGVGGVSYIGSAYQFNTAGKVPIAFAFPDRTGGINNLRNVVSTICHEGGHALMGFLHKPKRDANGNNIGTYGENQTMGNSLLPFIMQWTGGPNSAGQDQNEPMMMQANLGKRPMVTG